MLKIPQFAARAARRSRRLALLVLLAPLVPMLATTATAAEWGIDTLMQQLAEKRSERATFVEKKTISYLDKPVESSGELSFRAPDLLEKRTLKPKPETLRLEGDQLTIERAKKTHQIRLSDYPEMASFVESIRGTLSGDRKALERNYKITLEGQPERWTLNLQPTETKMAGMIQKISIAGRRNDVRSIEILQADGDRSVMTVEKIAEQ